MLRKWISVRKIEELVFLFTYTEKLILDKIDKDVEEWIYLKNPKQKSYHNPEKHLIYQLKPNKLCVSLLLLLFDKNKLSLRYNCYTWVSQDFCNVLVTWATIQQLRMLLRRSWRWRTTQDSKKLSSPDTFWRLLIGFASMVWSTATEFTF